MSVKRDCMHACMHAIYDFVASLVTHIVRQDCWAVDSDGNCTCHDECLSSCNGTTDQNCLSCRHYYYQGRCVSRCPNGTAILAGWRCVDVCPDNVTGFSQRPKTSRRMYKLNGECVFDCPHNYKGHDNGTCVLCQSMDSSCNRYCEGGAIRVLADAAKFKNCTHVNGYLLINIATKNNEEKELNKYLGRIQHVSDYVLILNCPTLRRLQFLDNLTSIRGDALWQFEKSYYGLAIVGNKNLLSITWNKQDELFLYGRIDVRFAVYNNMLLCEKRIDWLEKQFSYAVDQGDNGLIAVCNVNLLIVTYTEKNNYTELYWDGVPDESEAGESLLGYNINWYREDIGTSILRTYQSDYSYNENDPLCINPQWTRVEIGNQTSYRLYPNPNSYMIDCWKTTVVLVQAEFATRNVYFQSEKTSIPPYIRVPSSPTKVKESEVGIRNVTVEWSPPLRRREDITGYQIVLVQSVGDNGVAKSSVGGSTKSIDSNCPDTSVNGSFPCIHNTTNGIKRQADLDSCNGTSCQLTITQLENFVNYTIKIQAVSDAGCGLVEQKEFTTEPECSMDRVTNLTVTNDSHTESASTIDLGVDSEEQCKNGSRYNWYKWRHVCTITSSDKTISENFSLPWVCRQNNRKYQFEVVIQVVSNAEKCNKFAQKKAQSVSDSVFVTCPPMSGNDDAIRIVLPIVCIVCLCFVMGMLATWYIHRLKRNKSRLSQRLDVVSKLYLNMTHEQGMILTNTYAPDDWEIKREDVVLENELGSGAFGLVYRGTWQIDNNQLDVAVKTLSDMSSDEDRISFLNEASIMKNFESEHIVRLLGIVSIGDPVMVMMELMDNGDLKGYLRSLRTDVEEKSIFEEFPLLEDELLQFAVQIASGMAYLSEKKFIHRDLAARNCMVDKDICVKIGDFGLTRDVYETDYYRKRGSGPLPIRWMSPESLRDGVFGHPSDVWSYGIVLWEIATLAMQPYPGMSNSDVLEFVVGGGVMDMTNIAHAPRAYKAIMAQCWLFNEYNRPPFETILSQLPPLRPSGLIVHI
ncbi:insulin-like growth factor 1 receptor [Corticium candelabrum]|uniref:insulin-like growth factor 1 receptor n=1 Tax=Corticium candelabrum TaxID=121492 RepID=UPI002E259814|nr:insulin-like growth factor 1 receptor [Corticium candelabrum]